MGLGSNIIANDSILLELHADQFPDVFTAESTETETLDTNVATTSSGTVCFFRPGHS
jgi:hypothetical protein